MLLQLVGNAFAIALIGVISTWIGQFAARRWGALGFFVALVSTVLVLAAATSWRFVRAREAMGSALDPTHYGLLAGYLTGICVAIISGSAIVAWKNRERRFTIPIAAGGAGAAILSTVLFVVVVAALEVAGFIPDLGRLMIR